MHQPDLIYVLRISLILLLLFTVQVQVFGQTEDYVEKEDPYGYNEWTDYMLCYRAGVGIQSAFYAEGGISRLKYRFHDRGFASMAQYVSVEWTPTILPDKPRNVYGFKAGMEINTQFLAFGLEGKYQTDFLSDSWVITPKAGIGMFGIFNLFYGYNIWLVTFPFNQLGHHQLSIALNLNRYLTSNERSRPE